MKITNQLLDIEKNARKFFERIPFIQAFLAGVGVIIFWRGVWELSDRINIHPALSILIGCLILGGIGVFVQTFIGNMIIIKNVKREEEKEKQSMKIIEGEVVTEEITLEQISRKIDALAKKLEERG